MGTIMQKTMFTCLTAVGLLLGGSANAGGLKDAPAPIWTGFYGGVHAGYTWAESDGDLSNDGPVLLPYGPGIDNDGWLAGGQVGVNYQSGRWVSGIEADLSWMNAGGDDALMPSLAAPFDGEISTDVEMFGTARVRFGYLMRDDLLLYATGGLAWASVESETIPFGLSELSSETDETHIGWTVGGGLEWMLAGNWTVKSEYLYFDLGGKEHTYVPDMGTTHHYDTDLDGHVVRVGVNYKIWE